MNRTLRFSRLPALLVLIPLFASAEVPEPAIGAELYQLDRSLTLKEGMLVRVVNPYGNVRIRALPDAADGELRVTVQTDAGVANPAAIVERVVDGGLELGIVGDSDLRAIDGFLRADFVLGLPNRIRLEVELEEGDFTMHPADYPVTVRARSGSIRIGTTGEIDVSTLHGHVFYQPGGEGRVAGGRIQTSTAPVDVLIRRPERLNFEVVSGAAVTTDSLAILQRRSREGRALRFVDDEQVGMLRIQTDEAPVRLVVEGIR